MKVLVCGSRSWRLFRPIHDRLAALGNLEPVTVIHGGAPGADTLAGQAAAQLGLGIKVFHAEWDRYGKRAGVYRNLAMLDAQPDLVLGFWDGRSVGTKHTVTEARRRGIPVEMYGGTTMNAKRSSPASASASKPSCSVGNE